MRRARVIVLWLALPILIGCDSGPPPRQALLIVLDAARPDRFSAYGYAQPTTPHIDRLAANGLLFRNHYTQGTATRKALPALLYSRYFTVPMFSNSRHLPLFDTEMLFRRRDREAVALPRVLRDAGFVTAAISAHVFLRPDTEFAQEFSTLYDLGTLLDYDPQYGAPRAEQVIDFTIDWIEDHRKEDFFLYVHLMDTHFPHFLEDDAKELLGEEEYDATPFDPAGGVEDWQRVYSPAARRYLDALYDGSLRYADRQIGRLIDFLDESSRLNEMLIVITADHGEILLDRPGRLQHGGDWVEPVARIPLVVHYPRKVRPSRVDSFSDSVDVGPTMLGLLGVPIPEGKTVDGVDLMKIVEGQAPPKTMALIDGGIRDHRYKALFNVRNGVLDGEEPPDPAQLRGRLYDLQQDPRERRNLFHRERDVVRSLWSRYWTAMAPRFPPPRGNHHGRVATPAFRGRLVALRHRDSDGKGDAGHAAERGSAHAVKHRLAEERSSPAAGNLRQAVRRARNAPSFDSERFVRSQPGDDRRVHRRSGTRGQRARTSGRTNMERQRAGRFRSHRGEGKIVLRRRPAGRRSLVRDQRPRLPPGSGRAARQ